MSPRLRVVRRLRWSRFGLIPNLKRMVRHLLFSTDVDRNRRYRLGVDVKLNATALIQES